MLGSHTWGGHLLQNWRMHSNMCIIGRHANEVIAVLISAAWFKDFPPHSYPTLEASQKNHSFSCLTTPLIKEKPLLDKLWPYASSSPTRWLMFLHNALVTAAWQPSCLYKWCFNNSCMATRLFRDMMLGQQLHGNPAVFIYRWCSPHSCIATQLFI